MADKYELRVIGAGLPRTGTLSLKKALEILTTSSCYHMVDLMQRPGDTQLWLDAVKSNGKNVDWGKIFKDKYASSIDSPAESFWEELYEENKNAKVILTVRDTPESWLKSCEETVFKTLFRENRNLATIVYSWFSSNTALRFQMLALMTSQRWGIPKYSSSEAIKLYNHRIEQVKSKIPKENLLIFNVKEGWEPLCKFLGVPVPNEPFPNVNDRKNFLQKTRYRELCGYAIMTIGAGIIAGLGFAAKKYFF